MGKRVGQVGIIILLLFSKTAVRPTKASFPTSMHNKFIARNIPEIRIETLGRHSHHTCSHNTAAESGKTSRSLRKPLPSNLQPMNESSRLQQSQVNHPSSWEALSHPTSQNNNSSSRHQSHSSHPPPPNKTQGIPRSQPLCLLYKYTLFPATPRTSR